MPEKTPETLLALDKLRRNAHLGKHKHFSAADRSQRFHTYYGVPVVIINMLLGSVLFATLSIEITAYMKWVGAILALIAAGFSGMQTFFNYQKTFEAHRRIGNQYLSIARNCERLIAEYIDNIIDLKGLSEEAKRINNDYSKINFDAEAFPTNSSDYREALEIERSKEVKKEGGLFDRLVIADQSIKVKALISETTSDTQTSAEA